MPTEELKRYIASGENILTDKYENSNDLRTSTKHDLVDENAIFSHENPLNEVTYEISQDIRGEENNILTALCSLITKDLPFEYRFHIIIINKSSTGKSYFWNNILPVFAEHVIFRTAITEAAFKGLGGKMEHNILHIEQLETKNDSGNLDSSFIKHMISDNKVVVELKGVDEKGKQQNIIEEVNGCAIVCTTTTTSKIDPELLNRFVLLDLKEDAKQTTRILDHISDVFGNKTDSKAKEETLLKLQDWAKHQKKISKLIEEIKIPFAHKIPALLSKNVEMRRDYTRILQITCALAASNVRYREVFERIEPTKFFTDQFGNQGEAHRIQVIATLEDLQTAIRIAGHAMNRTVNKASQKTEEIYEKVIELSKESLDNSTTIREVTESFSGQTTTYPETTIRDHFKTLGKLGYLTTDYSTKPYRFSPLGKQFSHLNMDSITWTKEENDQWIKDNLDTRAYTWKISYLSSKEANSCVKEGKTSTKTHLVDARSSVDNLVDERGSQPDPMDADRDEC